MSLTLPSPGWLVLVLTTGERIGFPASGTIALVGPLAGAKVDPRSVPALATGEQMEMFK